MTFLQPVPSAARSYLCRCKDRKRYCPAFPLPLPGCRHIPALSHTAPLRRRCSSGKGKCRNSKFQSKQLFIKIIPAVQNFTAVALDRIRHGVVRNMQNSGEFSVQRKGNQSLFPAFQINFLLRCRYKRCKDFSRPGRPAHQQMPQISLMGIAMIKGRLFLFKIIECLPQDRTVIVVHKTTAIHRYDIIKAAFLCMPSARGPSFTSSPNVNSILLRYP